MSKVATSTTWSVAPLAECCEVIQGQSPPGESYNTDGLGMPFFQGKAEFGEMHPRVAKWCTQPTKITEPGDILISIRAPVGPTNLSQERACIGRGLAAIRPRAGIDSRYILYAIRASADALAAQGSGSTFDAISGETLRTHRIPVAPLAEQHRIVAEIEKQFTRLDAAVAALERTRANLKRYRASVLNAAVEGRLTNPGENAVHVPPMETVSRRSSVKSRRRAGRLWGSGSVPALTDAEIQSIPSGWAWVKVRDVGVDPDDTVQVGPMSMRSRDFAVEPDSVPVLNVGCVQWDSFDEGKANHLPKTIATSLSRYAIRPGDVLFTRSGTVGRCAVALERHRGWLMTFHLLRVRPDPLICSSRYLRIVFEGAPHIRRQTRGASIGTTRAGFNTNLLAELDVPLPPVDEQDLIVAEVERRISLLDALRESASRARERAKILRQSILKRAFEGKLVPQDPDDEPASVLLERIRAERAAQATNGAAPKRRGRTRAKR